MQIVAALILLLFIPRFVRYAKTSRDGTVVPRGWGNAIEAICEVLRKHVAQPALGPYTDRFVPYVWSVFFFVLTCNILGLIPLADWTKPLVAESGLTHGHGIGGTSTGNVWVTATLAACTFIMMIGNGLRFHGIRYVGHFFMGPFPISILIALLEMIGILAKCFALTMRLFANMVAGHVLLAVLLSFIGAAAAALGTVGGLLISIPVVLGSIAINMLELFVAFLQAFIFTFLTTMFVGQSVNIHHGHDHGDDHAGANAEEGRAHA
jgi:F-type H+-transporting ATPase subunit a